MEKNKNDSAAEISYHKIQRAAAIAAGTAGYLGHLGKGEIDRRMKMYLMIMEMETRARRKSDPERSWVKLLVDNLGRKEVKRL